MNTAKYRGFLAGTIVEPAANGTTCRNCRKPLGAGDKAVEDLKTHALTCGLTCAENLRIKTERI